MVPDELLKYVASELDRVGIPYFVTGSFAGMLYGDQRVTNDIDIVIDLRREMIDAFMSCFPTDKFYLERHAVEHAVANCFQFNVIEQKTVTKVDFMIAGKGLLDRERFKRIRHYRKTVDYDVAYSSPEDLILKKLEFHKMSESTKHLRDVAGILKISGNELDQNYLQKWIAELDIQESWQAAQKLASAKNP